MKQRVYIFFAILISMFMFSCAPTEVEKTTNESTKSVATESTSGEEVSSSQVVKVIEPIPSVVLRDDAKVWDESDGVLSSKPIAEFDMGSQVEYLGIDKKLKSGNKSYLYSKVRLDNGEEGWLSTVRLAKNAIPAVIVEATGLYSKPLVTTPISRIAPAGQIVAISLDEGKNNGFAMITFSYYEGDKISNPETRFIPFDCLSVKSEDLDTARLILKSFRNVEQQKDFIDLAFTLNSSFNVIGVFVDDPIVYVEPSKESTPISALKEIEILAVNPLQNGEAQPWYIGKYESGELVWVEDASVIIEPSIKQQLVDIPNLEDHSSLKGSLIPVVNLYQGLSFRKMVTDDQNAQSLVSNKALEMGEVLYTDSKEFVFEDITFIHLSYPNDKDGWSSKNYIAANAKPAVVTEGDIPTFSEPKLTALNKFKLSKYQFLAVHNEEENGFIKISYISQEDNTIYREIFIQKDKASLTYIEDDVNASLLLHKSLVDDDNEMKKIYLKKAAELNSFMQTDLINLYIRNENDAPVTE